MTNTIERPRESSASRSPLENKRIALTSCKQKLLHLCGTYERAPSISAAICRRPTS